MIDSSNYRYQNGSDVYISRIVKDLLSAEEVTSVAQAHRRMRDTFMDDPAIQAINTRISNESTIVDGQVSLSVELGTKNTWENSLVTQLNDVPFGYIGKGAQCVLKTELALKLNQLIYSIQEKYNDKQIIISTNSSFVANKLGLENPLLLDNQRITKVSDLPSAAFFKSGWLRYSAVDSL